MAVININVNTLSKTKSPGNVKLNLLHVDNKLNIRVSPIVNTNVSSDVNPAVSQKLSWS